jgi:hypothetical protein
VPRRTRGILGSPYPISCTAGVEYPLTNLGKAAYPRYGTYEQPWLRSAAFGYYLDSPAFLIIPIGRDHDLCGAEPPDAEEARPCLTLLAQLL